MPFYDVDEMGFVAQLSPLCHTAPFGETVYAENVQKARELGSRYFHGEYWLKSTLYLGGYDNVFPGVIHE